MPSMAAPKHYDVPRGTPLRNSVYVREYCHFCGEPMRVTAEVMGERGLWCRGCSGHRPSGGHYGPCDDPSPMWENIVRMIEDSG